MLCRSGMAIDARNPSRPGRSTSGSHRLIRRCLHQARSAVRCSASRMKGEQHSAKDRFVRWTFLLVDDSIELINLCSGVATSTDSNGRSAGGGVSRQIYYHVQDELFLDISTFCSSARSSFVLSAGGHAGGPCTLRRKCEPWPGSVARALRIQSHEIWQVTTGSLSDQPEPSESIETRHFSYFFSLSSQVLLSHRPSTSQALYSVEATAQQQSHIKLFPL